MIGTEYLAALSMTGPDTGAAPSLVTGTYRTGVTQMYISSATRCVITAKAAFDGATALTGIKLKLIGSRDGTNSGDLLITRNGGASSSNVTQIEHTITPGDVTASPGGAGVFIFDTSAHTGMHGGCWIQAQGVGGATKAGDSIVVDVEAM